MTTLDNKKKEHQKDEESDEEEEEEVEVGEKSEEEKEESQAEEEDDEEEESEEEIIDLDDDDEAEPNKRLSKKETNQLEGNNTNLKENLNTQISAEEGKTDEEKIKTGKLNIHNLDPNIVPKEDIVNFLLNSKELFDSNDAEVAMETMKTHKKKGKEKVSRH